jgi:hypothetical protein
MEPVFVGLASEWEDDADRRDIYETGGFEPSGQLRGVDPRSTCN